MRTESVPSTTVSWSPTCSMTSSTVSSAKCHSLIIDNLKDSLRFAFQLTNFAKRERVHVSVFAGINCEPLSRRLGPSKSDACKQLASGLLNANWEVRRVATLTSATIVRPNALEHDNDSNGHKGNFVREANTYLAYSTQQTRATLPNGHLILPSKIQRHSFSNSSFVQIEVVISY